MDREAMHLRDSLIPKYAQMVYNGFWYAPERESLQAMIDSCQARVTGTVRMKLYKGQAYPLGRKSPFSLYNPAMATFEEDDVYDQADAAGFIRLQGLRLLARRRQEEGNP
jgi:argininosuccinate synthase